MFGCDLPPVDLFGGKLGLMELPQASVKTACTVGQEVPAMHILRDSSPTLASLLTCLSDREKDWLQILHGPA